jgi:hypothetical protein
MAIGGGSATPQFYLFIIIIIIDILEWPNHSQWPWDGLATHSNRPDLC